MRNKVIQADRISQIVTLIEQQGARSIGSLAAHFGVSQETIRRDIRQLEARGRVTKVHGGVTLPDARLEAPYRARLHERAEAKQRIAKIAAREVSEGMTVLIDSGTTSFWVARELAHIARLTVVTNSLEVAGEILGRTGQRLFLAGGAINSDYRAAFDADAIAYSRRFVVDLAILSIGAIEADRGFLDFEPDEAAYKRAMLDRCRRVMMVADISKFERIGSAFVAGFADAHDLVTDMPPPQPIAEAARLHGTRLRVADSE
ncbi:DeoR/GlpR family DNA-binding transcription regulator [Stakelama pacifica]|uniref:DeoR family transcriptional regulator n=1 Tax=Stakelama pacifica TaxID=517720 RepID=A0A4R6G0B9_9SPHN|nr:DeoR/GlpR family DNA-binding transcription regulator [Stakelama pacifica]TDN86895.1 DeoR family transcriptional regulator [Stakelama pacifica]